MSKAWAMSDPMPDLLGKGPNQIKPIEEIYRPIKIEKSDLSSKKPKATFSAGGFMKSDKASNIMGGLANLSTGANNAVQGYTGTQSAINSGLHSAMQAAGP